MKIAKGSLRRIEMYLIVFNMTGTEIDIGDIEEDLMRNLNIIRIKGKCGRHDAEAVYDMLCSLLDHIGGPIDRIASEVMFPVVIKGDSSVTYLRSYGSLRRYMWELDLKINNLNWYTVYDVDM